MACNEPQEELETGAEAGDVGFGETAAETGGELSELQDRVLRLQAELENFRKRARREYDEAQRYREIDLLRDLLPVLDNIHRAIEASEKSEYI